jgi:hypothetical protein
MKQKEKVEDERGKKYKIYSVSVQIFKLFEKGRTFTYFLHVAGNNVVGFLSNFALHIHVPTRKLLVSITVIGFPY